MAQDGATLGRTVGRTIPRHFCPSKNRKNHIPAHPTICKPVPRRLTRFCQKIWQLGDIRRAIRRVSSLAAQTPVRYDAISTAIPISATRANGISVDQGISCPLVGLWTDSRSRSPPFSSHSQVLGAYDVTFFLGFRVKMQPQTTSAIIAATKIPSCSCCIVVFSVA